MVKCDECKKGELKHKSVEYKVLGVYLGEFKALVCTSCHETIFEAESMQAIENAAKAKNVWGLAAKTSIGTSGNSLDVRLPKSIADFLELKKGQEVFIEPMDKKKFQVILI